MHFSPYTWLGLLSQVVTSEGHGLLSVQAVVLPLKCPLKKPTQVWVNEEKNQTDCKMLLGNTTERFGIGQVWGVWESGEKAGKPTQEMFSCLQTLAFKMIIKGNFFFF